MSPQTLCITTPETSPGCLPPGLGRATRPSLLFSRSLCSLPSRSFVVSLALAVPSGPGFQECVMSGAGSPGAGKPILIPRGVQARWDLATPEGRPIGLRSWMSGRQWSAVGCVGAGPRVFRTRFLCHLSWSRLCRTSRRDSRRLCSIWEPVCTRTPAPPRVLAANTGFRSRSFQQKEIHCGTRGR